MKTKFTFIILFCLSTFIVNAQELDEISNYRIIKYSPISLVNIHFPAIQFAFEHNIGESRAMQYELGGIFLPNFFLTSNSLITHRALVEHRWYRNPMQMGGNKYQGVGFRFQKQYQNDEEFRVENALLALTKSNTATGFYYTRGRQFQFEKMTFELGSAIGIQYYDVSIRNVPNGIEESSLPQNSLFEFATGSLVVPMAFVVCKIGFGWKS